MSKPNPASPLKSVPTVTVNHLATPSPIKRNSLIASRMVSAAETQTCGQPIIIAHAGKGLRFALDRKLRYHFTIRL